MSSDNHSFAWDKAEKDLMGEVDTTIPGISARVWNYWMGGKDCYEVDREAGDHFLALYPGIADMARASRLFISRVVAIPGWRGRHPPVPRHRHRAAQP